MARSFLVILHRYQVIQERSEMNENKVRSKDEATNDFDELWSIGKHSAAAQHVFGEKKQMLVLPREREREREMEDEGGSKREEEERAAKKAKLKAEAKLKKSFRKPRTPRYMMLADPVPGQTVPGDLNVGARDDEEDMEMENVQSSSQRDITHLVPAQSSPTGSQQLSAQPLLKSSSSAPSASDAGRPISFDTDAFDQTLHRFESGMSDEAKFSEPENPVHQDASSHGFDIQPEPCKEICVLNRQASLSWSLSDHDVSSLDEACQSKPTGQHVGLLDKSGGPESEDHAMHDGSYHHSDESEQSVEGQYIGGSSGDEKSD